MQYGFPTRNSEKRTEHFTDGGFPVQRDGHIDRILHAWKAWHAAMHSFSVEKCEPEIELQSRRKRKDDMLIVVKYGEVLDMASWYHSDKNLQDICRSCSQSMAAESAITIKI